MNAFWKHCRGFLFHLFPHHLVSRIMYRITRLRTPLANPAIRVFIRAFNVDMHGACLPESGSYATFNEFFTRRLIPGARPIAPAENEIMCPADGYISQLSSYTGQHAIQAKGRLFSMPRLLGGGREYPGLCERGKFATIYLSPGSYHRVHMPVDGELLEMVHIPGRLFSVAPYAAETLDSLYARNERVVSIFRTGSGYMAVVMVGAVNVAAIETSWHGLVTPPRGKTLHRRTYSGTELKKGEELGVFNMGSTVIVAFESESIAWQPDLGPGHAVRMGQSLGRFTQAVSPEAQAHR